MDDTSGTGERPGLPERAITPNMLAAFNMERWRRAAGMTQEELGEELGGWTKRAVSAAERSWDGKKVRQFDADLIANLASIYRVPIPALFLPPPDDGEEVRYVVGEEAVPMAEVFALLWPDPGWGEDVPAARAYRQAVIAAMAKYGDAEAARDLAAAMAGLAEEEQIEDALRDARGAAGELAGLHSLADRLAAQNAVLQEALERALAAKRAGQ